MERTLEGHAKLIATLFRGRRPRLSHELDVIYLPARDPGGGIARALSVWRNVVARLKARPDPGRDASRLGHTPPVP